MTRMLLAICAAVLLAGCGNKGDLMGKEPAAPEQPPPVPRAVAKPIDPALRSQAIAVLDQATESPDPILRANGIEGLQTTIGAEAKDKILQGLTDASPIVRFAAAMAAGQVKLADAHDQLVSMVNDRDRSVQVAVRFALHRLGDMRYSHDLEKTAVDPERAVRANTAMALGLLGEKSALVILKTMTSDHEGAVRLQVAEAMWRLGDEGGLDILVAGTVSQAADDQIIAVLALSGPRDQRIIAHVGGKLVSSYTEVSLAAARSMGRLGSDAGYTIAQNAVSSDDPRQRALAALALGAIGRSDGQASLARLVKDGNVNVRIAAATAVLQLKAPTSPGGLTKAADK